MKRRSRLRRFLSVREAGLEVELSAAVLAEHTQAKFAPIGRA